MNKEIKKHGPISGRGLQGSSLAQDQRVFVNRNLRMANVGAIGFDLDHTLAHYRGAAVEELAFTLARDRLVDRFGYPEELRNIGYDGSFVIRGLVIDKRRGNILKMDYHNYVSRAYHGLRLLRAEERKAVYRTGRVRMSSNAYVTVDTLFHLPEVYLFVVLVNLIEKRERRKRRSFVQVYQDVRESIDSVHGDGTLKREILGNLGTYIRRDRKLAITLDELRRVGKKLFLLTNSEYYYSDALLTYLLGQGKNGSRDWREIFDVIVTDAGKPEFFTDFDRPAVPYAEAGTGDADPLPPLILSGGNARHLEHLLEFRGDQVLYFGDHTYGDILRSKKSLGWRTAMVVEELAEELTVMEQTKPEIAELGHLKTRRGALEADVSALELERQRLQRQLASIQGRGEVSPKLERRLEHLEVDRARLEADLADAQTRTTEMGETINQRFNPHWGPIFREGQETSRFAHQVKDFACIYMVRVSNLRYYNANHYFRSMSELLPHEIPG